jgi:hypothetical protein
MRFVCQYFFVTLTAFSFISIFQRKSQKKQKGFPFSVKCDIISIMGVESALTPLA